MKQVLSQVIIDASVVLLMLTQALSSDKEETMGLLLGNWYDDHDDRFYNPNDDYDPQDDAPPQLCRVTSLALLTRSDKRPDRVEVGASEISKALTQAERITQQTGEETNVVAWFHSHPKITVQPSHVDLGTQYAQQSMDDRFFGVIASCFNGTQLDSSQQIALTCFQAIKENGPMQRWPIPISIASFNGYDDLEHGDTLTPHILNALQSLPLNLRQEHKDMLQVAITAARLHRPIGVQPSSQPSIQLVQQNNGHSSVNSSSNVVVGGFRKRSGTISGNNRNGTGISSTSSAAVAPVSMAEASLFVRNSSTYSCALSEVIDKIMMPILTVLKSKIKNNQNEITSLEQDIRILNMIQQQQQQQQQQAQLQAQAQQRDRSPNGVSRHQTALPGQQYSSNNNTHQSSQSLRNNAHQGGNAW